MGSEIAINGQKVTVPLGEISSTLEGDKVITVTFRIQLKEGIIQEAGTYELPTNTAAKVTYKENGEIFYQIFEVPVSYTHLRRTTNTAGRMFEPMVW